MSTTRPCYLSTRLIKQADMVCKLYPEAGDKTSFHALSAESLKKPEDAKFILELKKLGDEVKSTTIKKNVVDVLHCIVRSQKSEISVKDALFLIKDFEETALAKISSVMDWFYGNTEFKKSYQLFIDMAQRETSLRPGKDKHEILKQECDELHKKLKASELKLEQHKQEFKTYKEEFITYAFKEHSDKMFDRIVDQMIADKKFGKLRDQIVSICATSRYSNATTNSLLNGIDKIHKDLIERKKTPSEQVEAARKHALVHCGISVRVAMGYHTPESRKTMKSLFDKVESPRTPGGHNTHRMKVEETNEDFVNQFFNEAIKRNDKMEEIITFEKRSESFLKRNAEFIEMALKEREADVLMEARQVFHIS